MDIGNGVPNKVGVLFSKLCDRLGTIFSNTIAGELFHILLWYMRGDAQIKFVINTICTVLQGDKTVARKQRTSQIRFKFSFSD